MTDVEFLKSSSSSRLFYGTKSQQQSLGSMLNVFDNGELENTDGKRAKYIKFTDIKDKIIGYIKLRAKRHKQEKCDTSWILLRKKCVE